jgi:hypothetical protein
VRSRTNGAAPGTKDDGTELANSSSAFVHALQVVRELMFGRTKMLGHPWSAGTMRAPGRRSATYDNMGREGRDPWTFATPGPPCEKTFWFFRYFDMVLPLSTVARNVSTLKDGFPCPCTLTFHLFFGLKSAPANLSDTREERAGSDEIQILRSPGRPVGNVHYRSGQRGRRATFWPQFLGAQDHPW